MHQPTVLRFAETAPTSSPHLFLSWWKFTNRMGVSTPQFRFPKGSLLHWYTCSHPLPQFISCWIIPLQLFMTSRYKVGCKLIWVQKLLWIAGSRKCEAGNSLLNQLYYARNSGTVSKVIFSLANFVCLMSLNSETSHSIQLEKNCRPWASPAHNLSKRKPYSGIGLQKYMQNNSGKPKKPQVSNIETRLDCVLLYTHIRKVQSC